MKLCIRYFGLELKRSGKMLLRLAFALLLALAVLALLAAGLTGVMKRLSTFDTVEVGMVIPEEDADADTMFAVRFLAAMDSVKSVSGFRYYGTKEEALAELSKGRLSAVICLPPYFFEDVDSGRNTPAEIYLPENAGLNTRVFVELLRAGVRMLQIAEAGVYATLDVAYEERPVYGSWSEAGNTVAYRYLVNALMRDGTYDSRVLSAFGETGYGQFYFAVVLLLVLMFSGLGFAHLYRKNNRALAQKLSAEGLGGAKLSAIRILVMTVLLWVQALVLYLAAYAVSSLFSKPFLIWDKTVAAGLLFLAFSLACYFHLVFALAGGDGAGCVALLALNADMVFGSGMLIPVSYLPEAVQRVSAALPAYQWNQLLLGTLFAELPSGGAIRIAAASVCAAIVGGVGLCRNS